MPRLKRLLKEVRPEVEVQVGVENVRGMLDNHPEDAKEVARMLGCEPVLLDMRGWGPALRPRLYWVTWPLHTGTGITFRDTGPVVEMEVAGDWPHSADRLEPGTVESKENRASHITRLCGVCQRAGLGTNQRASTCALRQPWNVGGKIALPMHPTSMRSGTWCSTRRSSGH